MESFTAAAAIPVDMRVRKSICPVAAGAFPHPHRIQPRLLGEFLASLLRSPIFFRLLKFNGVLAEINGQVELKLRPAPKWRDYQPI